jgi:hypothetical protein
MNSKSDLDFCRAVKENARNNLGFGSFQKTISDHFNKKRPSQSYS